MSLTSSLSWSGIASGVLPEFACMVRQKSEKTMASTAQEKIMPIDGMPFAEFADPSYFVFANRAARMAQERTISPGMAWRLFNDTIPGAISPNTCKRDSFEDAGLSEKVIGTLDDHGEEMNFQDPWDGISENHHRATIGNEKIGASKFEVSDLDVSSFFFGY